MIEQHDIIGKIKIVGQGLARINKEIFAFVPGTNLEERIIKAERGCEIAKFGVTGDRQIKSVVTI